MTDATKTVLIGWDGATWAYIDPLLEKNLLPNLAALLVEGTRMTLASTTPPYTNVAWPSLVTGLLPAKTGVFDAVTAHSRGYETIPTNLTGYRGTAIWHWLNKYGLRCGVLNVPVTFPAQPLDGYMVSGFDSIGASPEVAYPPGLLETWAGSGIRYGVLQDEIALIARQNPHQSRGSLEDFVKGWVSLTEEQGHTLARLWREEPVDFLFAVFSGTDSINHRTQEWEAITHVYQAADRALGELLRVIGDDTIVCLVSDHGSTPAHRYISLNRALYDAGWLRFRPQVAARHWRRVPNGLGHFVAKLWQRLPFSTRRFVSWPLLRWKTRLAVAYENIDWFRTRVYVRSGLGALYINRAGRKSKGTVPDSDYESLRERIITYFRGLRDQEGVPLFGSVHRSEDIYAAADTARDDVPDLVAIPARWSDHLVTGFTDDPLVREIPSQTPYGTHTPDGIWVLRGPNLRRGAVLNAASITDVVPTVLAAMAMPLPVGVDGIVQRDVFNNAPEIRWDEPILPQNARDDKIRSLAGGDEIIDRLRALGYLE